MNARHCNSNTLPRTQPILCLAVLCVAACADTSALRDKERAHYENIEQELIGEQEKKARRLREEYRVNQPSQQPDTAPTITTILAASTDDAAKEKEPDEADLSASRIQSSASTPLETQVVAAHPADAGQGSWKRQNYPNPIDGSPLCAVVSTPVVVQNGELDTQVNIVVSTHAAFLRTDAAFDANVLETGFQIDAGFPIPFDRYLNELTAVVDDNYSNLLRSMNNGTTLSVSFAYNPQLSLAETHVVEFTLETFNQVWAQMPQCIDKPNG